MYYNMETLIKLNNQTAGRDKIARVLQYLSRLLWHRLQVRHQGGVDQLKNIEYQLSSFRKILRFGRCFDVLYSTLPLFQHPDQKVKHILILSKICNALFLLTDHFLWLGRADISKVNTDKWSSLSNKYWLYSITMNLIRDFYEIFAILRRNQEFILSIRGVKSVEDVFNVSTLAVRCLSRNKNIVIDTVKNGCDFFIPLNALGHTSFTPGTIGWLGFISSVAGLLVVADSSLKLSPS